MEGSLLEGSYWKTKWNLRCTTKIDRPNWKLAMQPEMLLSRGILGRSVLDRKQRVIGAQLP